MTDNRVGDELPTDFLRQMFARIVTDALNGELSDSDRVPLLQLALTMAAEEFQRIEETYGTKGAPAVDSRTLRIIQQIALICEADPEKLRSGALLDPMTGEPYDLDELDEEED